jgi:hypothetical protein
LCAIPEWFCIFHGGLVPRQKGILGAERLARQCYDRAPSLPVFFIWESGLLDVLNHNLTEIAGEEIFKTLEKWLLKFVVGKLLAEVGVKAPQLPLPSDMMVYRELARRDQNEEPYSNFAPREGINQITTQDRKRFESALASDAEFQSNVQAITNALVPKTVSTGAKGAVMRVRKSARTLMSPAVVDNLKADVLAAKGTGAKGLLTTARLIKAAGMVLIRVTLRLF